MKFVNYTNHPGKRNRYKHCIFVEMDDVLLIRTNFTMELERAWPVGSLPRGKDVKGEKRNLGRLNKLADRTGDRVVHTHAVKFESRDGLALSARCERAGTA